MSNLQSMYTLYHWGQKMNNNIKCLFDLKKMIKAKKSHSD